MNLTIKTIKYGLACVACCMAFALQGCSDEPDAENYYTFTGEMMSDFIKNRPQYSDFATIVNRADLMDLLSSYGHYTCFLPSNEAISAYLNGMGKHSVDDLTDAECDTLARTHLVANIYYTTEMDEGTLHSANMNHRYITIQTDRTDEDGNPVIFLNKSSHIYYDLKDDSVQNGVVQPIDKVLVSSNSTVAEIMKQNDRISYLYNAIVATGLKDSIMPIKDESYDAAKYPQYRYKSHTWNEVAEAPDERKIGFTVFVEPNDLYEKKGVVKSAETALKDMYDYACSIYDVVYPEDANQPYHDFSQITDRRNPLNRFVAYHIVTRDVKGYNYLTPLPYSKGAYKGQAMGIKENLVNPNDWYETMLPHTMMKFEKLTVPEWIGYGIKGDHYINRRYDNEYQIEGAHIQSNVEDQYEQDAPNGRYFYVDDILAFSDEVQNTVMNCRIRMDFSTVFREIMTNDIRLNGDPTTDDDANSPDFSFKNGKNYYFPAGYLDGVTSKGNCTFVYRRPHWNFWSYEGDEFNLFGDYDFEFRLPPVPFDGEYQFRLGFCALETRGVAQIYFDGVPQGIPVDMRRFLNTDYFIGTQFSAKKWANMTEDEKLSDQKALKNKGVYRGPYGGFHTSGSSMNEWVDNERTYRLVMCQVPVDSKKDHYIRIRCTSSSKLGNNNEFMIDYLEIVPKSVYGVGGANQMEDDL